MIKKNILNRIIAVWLLLALLLPAGFAMPVRAEDSVTGTVNAKELYMRTGPGTSYDKVQVLGQDVILVYGQEITVLGEKDGWYHVRAIFNGRVAEGYSLAAGNGTKYIVLPSGAKVTGEYKIGTITATELNVRKGPSTDYDKVQVNGGNVVLRQGMIVSVLDSSSDWYKVNFIYNSTDVVGYCLGKYITLSSAEPEPAPKYTYGKVTATQLNVRKGPSTAYDKVQLNGSNVVFETGQQVAIIEETDGWYHLTAEYKGAIIEGYCSGAYIAVEDGAVIGNGGTDSGATAPAEPVDKTEKEPEEVKEPPYVPQNITDFSHGIPAGYLAKTEEFVATFAYKGKIKAESGVNLLETASATATVVGTLDNGAEVTVIKSVIKTTKDVSGNSISTRWYRVVYEKGSTLISGYVIHDYVTLKTGDGIAAKAKYGSQKLLKKMTSTALVRDEDNEVVKLKKGTPLTIIGEKLAESGEKYFKVTAEYNGQTVTGFMKAMKVTFVAVDSSYSLEYLEADPDYKEPEPEFSFAGANAIIRDASGLTVHTEPSNSSEILRNSNQKPVMLYTGDSVEIIDVSVEGDYIWCYVRLVFKGVEYCGYVRSTHLETDARLELMSNDSSTMSSAMDFESKLEREGFPESYRVLLRELHEQYPSWEFKAYHTGLDWNYVISAESAAGINLLPNSKSVGWKSTEAGAYSWKSDTFIVFDSPSWVTASKKAVEYYMDPRNFMTENAIFQFEVLNFAPSYQSKEGVAQAIKNTALSNKQYSYTDDFGTKRTLTYEDTFMMAAEYTGVNPIHLASRVKQEVVIGTNSISNSISGTVSGYEGLYNFYNIGAYHSTESGGAIRNGLKFAQNGGKVVSLNTSMLIPWTNPFKAILGGAYFLGYNYINAGQDTIYLQKFNVNSDNGNTFSHQYMANIEAPYSEGIRMYRSYDDVENTSFIFKLPVYLNMPEEPCPVPTEDGNPNNWLKTLKIYDANGKELALTPTFDYTEDQEYNLVLDTNIDSLKISTTTVSSLATVTSKKSFSPAEGMNKFTVKVKAENGDVRKYVINIYREPSPDSGNKTGNDDVNVPEEEIDNKNPADENVSETTNAENASGNEDGAGTDSENAGSNGDGAGTDSENAGSNGDGAGTDSENAGSNEDETGTDSENAGSNEDETGTDSENAGSNGNGAGTDSENAGSSDGTDIDKGTDTDSESASGTGTKKKNKKEQ